MLDLAYGSLYPKPARRAQNNDGQTSRSQILLVFQVTVSRHECGKSLRLCSSKQLAVRQPRPAAFICRHDFVWRQKLT